MQVSNNCRFLFLPLNALVVLEGSSDEDTNRGGAKLPKQKGL